MKYTFLSFDPQQFDSLYSENRNELEMRQFLAYGIAVAAKSAPSTASAMDRLLEIFRQKYYTLDPIYGSWLYANNHTWGVDDLSDLLKTCGFGFYTQRAASFLDAFDKIGPAHEPKEYLRWSSREKLTKIKGISFKTAGFFLLYNHPGSSYVAIDRHIWKLIRQHRPDAPEKIPTKLEEYDKWSHIFLTEIKPKLYPNMTNAEFDFKSWETIRSGKEMINV